MSKMPSNEYAVSSLRVVSRVSAHNIRSVMLKSDKEFPHRALTGMPVILRILHSRDILLPSGSQSLEKNSTNVGAISS